MTNAPTAFTGTADYYARYRPPYPSEFLAELRTRSNSRADGMLLDLACGPGRVAIPMATHFGRVLAVDVEGEMIETGRREASARGLANVEWRVSRAEDLQLLPNSIDLITVGEAFHRLDAAIVLRRAVEWLRPGGSFASLAGETIWRGRDAWRREIVRVVNKWTGGVLGDPNTQPWGGPVSTLRAAGFEVREYEMRVEYAWTCDSIVGFVFSSSIASRRVLGADADRFEAELRAALLDVEPAGRFVAPLRFGFALGTR